MTLLKLRGQSATATVYEYNGSKGSELTLGVLDNVTVQLPEQEVEELRGAGPTEWQDVQATERAAGLSGEWSAVSEEAIKSLGSYDETAGKIRTDPEVDMFIADVEWEDSETGDTFAMTVGPGYVDGSIEIGGDRESWAGLTFDLRAKTASDIETITDE